MREEGGPLPEDEAAYREWDSWELAVDSEPQRQVSLREFEPATST